MAPTKKQLARAAATLDETNESHAYQSESMPMEESYGTATIAAGPMDLALTEAQNQILEDRGIDLELAVKMGWRSAPRKGSGNDIQIPYYRGEKEVNCKTRSISGEKRFYQITDGEKCFYNVDAIQHLNGAPLVITEGEMDCMIALQCGYQAVSVPDGAPNEEIGDKDTVKYDYLRDIPKDVKQIILAVDGDAKGINLLNDLALRLGRHRCMWVQYPKECKDLNDVYKKYGSRGVEATMKRVQYMKISGLHRMSDLPPLVHQDPLDVGVAGLLPHLKLRRGDMSVWTGIPSMGKTTVTNYITYNMAYLHGWNICYGSFEQPPQTEHRYALRTMFNREPVEMQDDEKIAKADAFIDQHFSFILPVEDFDNKEDEEVTLEWLLDRMAAAVTRYNCAMVVIDPWNEMDHAYDEKRISLTRYVGMAVKSLKKFAKKYNVHVAIVAHPAKLIKKKDGSYPVPTLYDISDSAHWYNKCDQGIVVHRAEDKKTLVRIAKSRWHKILGRPGDVEILYDDYNGTFS